jgi:hypothetical protein
MNILLPAMKQAFGLTEWSISHEGNALECVTTEQLGPGGGGGTLLNRVSVLQGSVHSDRTAVPIFIPPHFMAGPAHTFRGP